MARLPNPGGDNGDWGTILNSYLSVSLNSDGTIAPAAIQAAGAVTSINGLSPSSGALTLATGNLSDVSISSPSNNQVLTYNSSSGKWVNQIAPSAPVTSVFGRTGAVAAQSGDYTAAQVTGALQASNNLSDVASEATAFGNIKQNATSSATGVIQLAGDLGNTAALPKVESIQGVVISGTPSNGQTLIATSGTAAAWSTPSSGSSTLASDTDVSISSPANNQVLTYNGTASKWENLSPQAVNSVTVVSKTSSYVAMTSDEVILADATSGPVTITLPTAAGNSNLYDIKKIDASSNAVTIATSSSQTIDGGSTANIRVQYVSVSVVSNGSNWFVI